MITRAADFIQTIGVGVHIDQSASSYGSSNVLGQMNYLGIDNMRVEAPYANLPLYTSLGAGGIKFDVISTDTNVSEQIGYLNSIAPYVVSAEGPNEVNTDPLPYLGLTGAAASDAYQADFYNAIRDDALLNNVAVLPFSLSVGGDVTGYGSVAAYANYGNVHGYASDGVPPYYMLGYAVSSITTTPGLQPIMTETGYYTLFNGTSGVNQDVQAKWLMDSLLENSASGVAKTYLYQLEDQYADTGSDPEKHYGLFTVDGTAKQSAVDIHNLTTLLADPGAAATTFTPGTLDFTLSGMPVGYAFDTVFAKSNGSYDVALWSEPQFYNASTNVEATVAPSIVTLALTSGSYNVSVFDPVLGTTAISSYSNVSSVKVSLTTDPLIIQVTPVVSNTVVTTVAGKSTSVTINTIDGTVTANGTDTVGTGAATQQLTVIANGNTTVNASTVTQLTFTGNATQSTVTTDAAGAANITLNGGGNIRSYGTDTIAITAMNIQSVSVSAHGSPTMLTDAGSGRLTVYAGTGTTTMHAGSGVTTFLGSTGDAILTAGSGTSTLHLGSGNNTVTLAGTSTVQAGTGTDLFNLVYGSATHDIISSFSAAKDHVHLSGYGVANPMANVTYSGASSVLNLSDGSTVTFYGSHAVTAATFV